MYRHSTYTFLFRHNIIKDLTNEKNIPSINWNPETGYPVNLPAKYNPRPAAGL